MSRYDRQVAQAVRMIKQYGQVVTWRKQTVEAVDSDKPWKTSDKTGAGEPVDYQVSIVFPREGKGLANALYHLIKGTDIPDGSPRGLMAVVPFAPELTDVVIRDGVLLQVASIDVVAPGGVPILYELKFS